MEFNDILMHIFLTENLENIVSKITNQLNETDSKYLTDEFIEFIFNKTSTFEFDGKILCPIHYLFFNMTPNIFNKIKNLKLNFNLLTPDGKHILYYLFLFSKNKQIDFNNFVEFINYNNIDFFELNNTYPFITALISTIIYNGSSLESQLLWYNFIFSNNKNLLNKVEHDRYIPFIAIAYGFDITILKKADRKSVV